MKSIQVLFLATFFVILTGCKQGSFNVNGASYTGGNTTSSCEGSQTSCQTSTSIQSDVIEFTQQPRKADIVVVIDNSDSMEHHQDKLANRFGNISEELEEIDWQMAFVSTDTRRNGQFYNLRDANGEILDANGNTIQFLSPSVDYGNPSDIYAKTINHIGTEGKYATGDEGDNIEQPLGALKLSLEQNKDAFRSDAALAVIVLTNEDEQGVTRSSHVITSVQNQLGTDKRFFAYGILIEPPKTDDILSTPCLEAEQQTNPQAKYGTYISKLVKATNGTTSNICETDYTSMLGDLSNNMKNKLSATSYQLKDGFIESTLQVSFFDANGQEITRGYRFDSQSGIVTLDEPLEVGMKVQITYDYDANASL